MLSPKILSRNPHGVLKKFQRKYYAQTSCLSLIRAKNRLKYAGVLAWRPAS